MASPSGIPGLTDNEIDEEIMNEDLKHLGIGDDLSNMDLQEKKNLLSAIKESAETKSDIETTPEKQGSTDTKMNSESPNNSSTNSIDFPDLPKPKNTRNKLILSTKNYGKKNNLESQSPNLDRPRKQFCLPFCDDDDAPPLVLPEDCPIMINAKKTSQETYGRGYEEREREIRNMIQENDSWLKLYSKVRAIRQLKTSELTKETVKKSMVEEEDEEEKSPQKTESITSQSSTKVEDDIYAFISEESCTVTPKQDESQSQTVENTLKGKSTIKKTNTPTIEEEPQMDQDDDIFRSSPLSPFTISDMENKSWSNVTSRTRHRNKPGKFSNLKKSSSCSTPEVETNFNEKWNPQTGTWDSSHKYITRSTNRNQENSLNKSNIKEKQTAEIKVQCPICQQDFLQSKIENHAAECDIFFSEGTSNKPDTRMSDNQVSSLPGPSGQKKNQRGPNKRERDDEEEKTPKRFLRSLD